MALIQCPECGREISHAAVACPFCGCPATLWTSDANRALFQANNKSYVVVERGYVTFFGRYPFEADGTVKPIPWYVWSLDPVKKIALLLCERIIDVKPYNQGNTSAKWKEASLYHWLNHSFAKESFTAAEYAKLLHPFDDETEDSIYERVFLPSETDVDAIFPDKNEARRCKVTPYAKSRGAWIDKETDCGAWWINKSYGTHCVAVEPDGTLVREKAFAVDYDDIGVRPIILLSYTPSDKMVNAPEGTVGYVELN